MSRRAATAPASSVVPSMRAASSSTTPWMLGKPPRPTLWSLGSASATMTPPSAASSALPPRLRISRAARLAATPPGCVERMRCPWAAVLPWAPPCSASPIPTAPYCKNLRRSMRAPVVVRGCRRGGHGRGPRPAGSAPPGRRAKRSVVRRAIAPRIASGRGADRDRRRSPAHVFPPRVPAHQR